MRATLLFISAFGFAGLLRVAAQMPSEPLSIRTKDVARIVMQAPPAYIRQASDTDYHVGLFDKKGRQLLASHYYLSFGGYDTGVALRENILFLMAGPNNLPKVKALPGYYYGLGAYARNGQLLYHPFLFDNGPDYFVEGRQRFVHNNKMGFVNRLGEITVPAKYPFVSPYENGVAYACLDCVYKTVDSVNKEHGTYFVGNDIAVIDKKGKILARQRVKERALPQFKQRPEVLNQKEKALTQLILKEPVMRRALHDEQVDLKKLKAVCYDRPSSYSPFYHFAFSDPEDSWIINDFQFLISPDGKRMYHFRQEDLQVTETMAEWQKNLDNRAKEQSQ